ncbi:transglutaminase-like cysteine peptidase [Ruegeria sp. Ofav3-42]|uniref:transglutaminase-like cysteine peptidase n=1 Tax=Ruegeria sp. Ofav3-42 TaxID=2917759 RepID=UPI001EF3E51F|nr:transglutaminase-like cysteine peptidase [Ruegeria sp. Ofav3-42]MCG7518244.1 transglutaminase-like cysteine peptidase [Ruegeria sp. Ofav3-42]
MKSVNIGLKTALGRFVTNSGRAVGIAAFVFGAAFAGSRVDASEGNFIRAVAASPPPSGAQQLCRQYAWACSSKASVQMTSQQEMQIIQRVNRHVNATTQAITDQSQYRTRERWALPTSRGGDCEDFALLKKRDLIRAGVDPSKLLIATVLDTRRNAHAVLVYRSAGGDLVLDNLTNRIKPWSATRYLFLRMQDPKKPSNWVGVYGKS